MIRNQQRTHLQSGVRDAPLLHQRPGVTVRGVRVAGEQAQEGGQAGGHAAGHSDRHAAAGQTRHHGVDGAWSGVGGWGVVGNHGICRRRVLLLLICAHTVHRGGVQELTSCVVDNAVVDSAAVDGAAEEMAIPKKHPVLGFTESNVRVECCDDMVCTLSKKHMRKTFSRRVPLHNTMKQACAALVLKQACAVLVWFQPSYRTSHASLCPHFPHLRTRSPPQGGWCAQGLATPACALGRR